MALISNAIQTSPQVLSFFLPMLINEVPNAWFSVYRLIFLQCEKAKRLLVMVHAFLLLMPNCVQFVRYCCI